MPRLLSKITDRDGVELATLPQELTNRVEIPLNDARLGGADLSLYHPAVAHVSPLDRMLKTWWGDTLVFWGPVLTPQLVADEASATAIATINAHDPSLAWKKNYHRFGDQAVELGYPVDGIGMWICAQSAIPSYSQRSRGIPHPGWMLGLETSDRQIPKPDDIENPESGDGIWAQARRGDRVWESIQAITTAVIGPDYDLRPIDAQQPGALREWAPGFFCEWNVYSERLVDRTDEVVFTRGWGTDNCSRAEVIIDGDAVVNYAVSVPPGGEKERTDTRKALVHDEASWQAIGIYQSWYADGSEKVSAAYLEEVAKATVGAYTLPPKGVTLTLRDTAPQYLSNFTVGDLVRVVVRQGYFEVDLPMRVMKVTLEDDGKAGRTLVDVIPRFSPTLDATDPLS